MPRILHSQTHIIDHLVSFPRHLSSHPCSSSSSDLGCGISEQSLSTSLHNVEYNRRTGMLLVGGAVCCFGAFFKIRFPRAALRLSMDNNISAMRACRSFACIPILFALRIAAIAPRRILGPSHPNYTLLSLSLLECPCSPLHIVARIYGRQVPCPAWRHNRRARRIW